MGQMIPLREISSFPKALAGLESYPWYGPAGLRPFADLGKLGQQMAQNEWDRPYRKTLINVAGYFTHLPAGQVNTIIDGFEAIENGDVEGGRTVLAPLAGPPRE
jgi:hypothetical protein